MQFTPQQMRGGGKYATHTKIGNWQEEIAVEDSKQADFQRKASNGQLLLRVHQFKASQCTQRVPHSFSSDGGVRFGDYINLVHDLTGIALACDPYDDVFPPWNKFQVSGTVAGPPIARTTFKIVRPPADFINKLTPQDDILRYGQPFSLVCNESLLYTEESNLRNPDLYLSSTLKNDRTATKSSNRQCVYISSVHNCDAVWSCMRPSKGREPTSERFFAIGQPIAADLSFVLTHHSSNTFLKADESRKEYTDFGVEAEICAEKTSSIGKLSLVVSERLGTATPQTLTKPDIPSNLWHFVYSDNPAVAHDRRSIPPAATFEGLIRELRRQVLSRGIFGFVDLRHQILSGFRGGDTTRETALILHREDARLSLLNWGIDFKDSFFDILLDGFDKRRSGHVDMNIILEYLSVNYVEGECDFTSRNELVNTRFLSICDSKRTVTTTELAERFRPSNLPFVVSGQYTVDEVLDSFYHAFPRPNKRGQEVPVRRSQFLHFFQDIGASIPDDNYFRDVVEASFE